MGNSCSLKRKKTEDANISGEYLQGYQKGYAAGLEIGQIKQVPQLDLSSDDEFTEDDESKSLEETGISVRENEIIVVAEAEKSEEITTDPPESVYLFVFSDFINPNLFKHVGFKVVQGGSYCSPLAKKNIKMFYQPAGADCSDLISKMSALDCQVVSFLDDAKPPRIIFEYLGEVVSFSYLCHPKKKT